MTLHFLEIPEKSEELAPWLERRLLEDDLPALAAELAGAHGEPAQAVSLDEALSEQLPQVLQLGLQSLSVKQLNTLLTQPLLLLQLQEQIFARGGDYWFASASIDEDLVMMAERGRNRLEQITSHSPVQGAVESQTPWRVHSFFIIAASAALVLLGVLVWQTYKPAPTAVADAWGWSRENALREDLSADAYLERLADLAGVWFSKRPRTAFETARRISEFRQGCSRLILAEHPPLSPDERQWLITKCRDWGKKLDDQLQQLEAGEKSPLETRQAVDEIVRRLIDALRARLPEEGKG